VTYQQDLKSLLRGVTRGSKVIVTSRSDKVGLMMSTAPLYHLKVLSEEDCWFLFKQHAFGAQQAEENLTIIAIGKEIIRKLRRSSTCSQSSWKSTSFWKWREGMDVCQRRHCSWSAWRWRYITCSKVELYPSSSSCKGTVLVIVQLTQKAMKLRENNWSSCGWLMGIFHPKQECCWRTTVMKSLMTWSFFQDVMKDDEV